MLTVLPPSFVSLCTSSRYGGKLEVNDALQEQNLLQLKKK